jgi:ketol-acid reductoisomerase
MLILD